MDHLESIRTFVRVAEIGSFVGAASTRGVSSAVTTRLVGSLESRLGVQLFLRTTRRVSLTETGQIFLERARQIVADIDEIESLVANQQAAPAGPLRIAAPHSFGHNRLGPLLKAYVSRYPEIKPHVTLTDKLIDLVELRIDVAIVPEGWDLGNTVVTRKLSMCELAVVASPEYIERHGLPLEPSDLRTQLLLHEGAHISVTRWAIAQSEGLQMRPANSIGANSVEMLGQLALEGIGVAVMPTYLVEADIAQGKLVRILPEHQLPHIGLNLAFASRKHLPANIRTFVDFMIEQHRP
ncbi:LysR substrate-binding domain-containing protein [Paraburkholderia sp. 32]|uniref:LysR family transcriptional regulator n=1 Tax=unclassified Paraburkholderia TaxID=2615204 RepID=UPI003D20CC80